MHSLHISAVQILYAIKISAGGVGQWADGEDHAAVDGAVRDARSRSEGASGFSADVVAVGGTPRVVEKGHT